MSRALKNVSRESPSSQPLHVSVLALPESMMSPVSGIYEVLSALHHFAGYDDALPREARFRPEIVAPELELKSLTSEWPMKPQRVFSEITHTDIIIVPSMMVRDDVWICGRYPELVGWIRKMHAAGAELCSACSGIFLLAETGLWNGREVTTHWAFARSLEKTFPALELRLHDALVVSGERGELISSGAATAWHDMILFLIARHIGPTAAQAIARFLLMQWHADGQSSYMGFSPRTSHGDALMQELQTWLEDNYSAAGAVEALVKRSGLAERTLKRRFTKATGLAPLAYIQRLRIEEAKRRLERTDLPVDEISWAVGYEEPAFFRRLFKRVTTVTPGEYRRKFRVPDFARAGR